VYREVSLRHKARRYVDAAVAAELDRECGVGQLSDELIGAVVPRSAQTVRKAMVWRGNRCAPTTIRSKAGPGRV
jgi:hypothetical protein